MNEDRDRYYSEVFEKYLILLGTLIIFLISITKPLLNIIVEPSYYEAWKYTPILYLAVFINSLSSFIGVGYLTTKNTFGAFQTSVVGAAITLILSLILVPQYQLYGASISVLVGYLNILFLRIHNTKSYFTLKISTSKVIFLICFLCLICLLSYQQDDMYIWISIVLALTGGVFLNYNYLLKFKQELSIIKL